MFEVAKREILQIVTDKQGCKFAELIPCLSKQVICSDVDILEVVELLISTQELIALRYILPSLPYREKMLLFPKETRVGFVTY